jgi:hypothetical protein
MTTRAIGLTRVFAAALLFVSTACAEVPELLSVERESSVEREAIASTATALSGPQMLAGFFNNAQGNGAPCLPDESATDVPSQIQSAAWIGSRGGEVQINGSDASGRPLAHLLVLPAGAVTQPTLFCMRLDPTNHMAVELFAHAIAEDGGVMNVAKYGLALPARLYMAYSSVHDDRQDSRRVVIVSVPTSGPVETMDTATERYVGYAHTVVRRLSKYALALD